MSCLQIVMTHFLLQIPHPTLSLQKMLQRRSPVMSRRSRRMAETQNVRNTLNNQATSQAMPTPHRSFQRLPPKINTPTRNVKISQLMQHLKQPRIRPPNMAQRSRPQRPPTGNHTHHPRNYARSTAGSSAGVARPPLDRFRHRSPAIDGADQGAEEGLCYCGRCAQEGVWRAEGSGPHFHEFVRTPWSGLEERLEVW